MVFDPKEKPHFADPVETSLFEIALELYRMRRKFDRFERSMNSIAKVMKVTPEQLQKLKQQADAMGAEDDNQDDRG